MSTRSTIAVQLPNGKIKAAYCHFDGYPEVVGRALVNHYKTAKAANALVKKGKIRCISTETGVAQFYNEPSEVYENMREWRDSAAGNYDYGYFFDPESKSWICLRDDEVVCLMKYHNQPPVKIDAPKGTLTFASA